jgi:hypothetical protein
VKHLAGIEVHCEIEIGCTNRRQFHHCKLARE